MMTEFKNKTLKEFFAEYADSEDYSGELLDSNSHEEDLQNLSEICRSHFQEPSANSNFQAALEDKNRLIENLKRRIINQQIQLSFFFRKNLKTETLIDFSFKCYPELADENTQLSLAVHKFIRESGGKTRLGLLYESLNEHYEKIENILFRIEDSLKQYCDPDDDTTEEKSEEYESVKRKKSINIMEGDGTNFQFMRRVINIAHMEVSTQLLNVSMNLNDELQRLRHCVEKVIDIEEDRNNLVDRVFALTPEQRFKAIQIAKRNDERLVASKVQKIDESITETTLPSMNTASPNSITGLEVSEDCTIGKDETKSTDTKLITIEMDNLNKPMFNSSSSSKTQDSHVNKMEKKITNYQNVEKAISIEKSMKSDFFETIKRKNSKYDSLISDDDLCTLKSESLKYELVTPELINYELKPDDSPLTLPIANETKSNAIKVNNEILTNKLNSKLFNQDKITTDNVFAGLNTTHFTVENIAPEQMETVTNDTQKLENSNENLKKEYGGLINRMETEVLQLFLLSEKQKKEYLAALEKVKDENIYLRERLNDIENLACDEHVIQLQEKCFRIERDVNDMRKFMEIEQLEKETMMKQMANELHIRDLKEISYQREILCLQKTIKYLESNFRKKMSQQDKKSSYIHSKRYNFTDNFSVANSMKTNVSTIPYTEVKELTDLVILQEGQIKELLTIMSNLGLTNQQSDTKTNFSITTGDLTDPEGSEYHTTIIKKEVIQAAISNPIKSRQHIPKVEHMFDDFFDEDSHIFFDSDSEDKLSTCLLNRLSDFSDSESNSNIRLSKKLSGHKILNKADESQQQTFPKRSSVAKTSLLVETKDKDGNSKLMNAVLECSSTIDEFLEMDHMQLQCNPQKDNMSFLTVNDNDTGSNYCTSKQLKTSKVFNRILGDFQINKDAKKLLSTQLTKLKNQLQTDKPSFKTALNIKDILQSLNDIYYNLFDDIDTVDTI